jgi:hypothetical protein
VRSFIRLLVEVIDFGAVEAGAPVVRALKRLPGLIGRKKVGTGEVVTELVTGSWRRLVFATPNLPPGWWTRPRTRSASWSTCTGPCGAGMCSRGTAAAGETRGPSSRAAGFTAAGAELRAQEKIPKREFDSSPLVKAILDSGYAWEEDVLQNYLKERVAIASGSGKLHERRFNAKDTNELLRTAEPGTFIYQSTLKVSPAFYARYGIDPTRISVSENHPDLIAVHADGAGGRLVRILDVKRGEALRFTHRVQILFYALELADLLQDQGIEDAAVDLGTGAVWLGGQSEPMPFDLNEFRPYLEGFLRNDLERILRQDLDCGENRGRYFGLRIALDPRRRNREAQAGMLL